MGYGFELLSTPGAVPARRRPTLRREHPATEQLSHDKSLSPASRCTAQRRRKDPSGSCWPNIATVEHDSTPHLRRPSRTKVKGWDLGKSEDALAAVAPPAPPAPPAGVGQVPSPPRAEAEASSPGADQGRGEMHCNMACAWRLQKRREGSCWSRKDGWRVHAEAEQRRLRMSTCSGRWSARVCVACKHVYALHVSTCRHAMQ